jgi:hypothetical protein
MTGAHEPHRPVKIPRPQSINDNLPSSNPSGKTVLIVLGCAIVVVLVWVLFYSTFGV